MNNFGFNGGAYGFGPAANIERTLYGTTVVRVADERTSRPQMAMPFFNQLAMSQDPQFKAGQLMLDKHKHLLLNRMRAVTL